MTATLDAAPQDVQILSFDFTTGVLELFNFGAEAVSLDGWQFCSHNGSSTREYTSPNGMNGLTVQPTMSLFIHYDGDSPPAARTIETPPS